MAEIFLARAETDLGASRLCVVKEILPELADVSSFADMLVFEAKLAARLNHANIVQVFDLGRTEGRLYIAMEYVEGYDLNALLRIVSKKKVPFLLEHALHVIGCVLRALSFAHRAKADDDSPLGIVHRDVSPSNVLISLDGEVKLCDFGIAKANDRLGARAGEVGEALRGKAGYMSPEHARGEAIDARADVFAAGILLWELLSGRRMYRAGEGETLLDVARRAEVPELTPRGEVPELERLRGIVMRALSVDPSARYESAAAMSRDLDDYLAKAGVDTNPLRFGEWLRERVGSEELDERRERERLLTPHGEVKVAEFSSLRDEPAKPAEPASAEPEVAPASAPSPEVASEPASAGIVSADDAPPPAAEISIDGDRFEVPLRPSHIPVPSIGAMRTFVRDLEHKSEPDERVPASVPPPRKSIATVLMTIVLIVVVLCVIAALAVR